MARYCDPMTGLRPRALASLSAVFVGVVAGACSSQLPGPPIGNLRGNILLCHRAALGDCERKYVSVVNVVDRRGRKVVTDEGTRDDLGYALLAGRYVITAVSGGRTARASFTITANQTTNLNLKFYTP